MDNEPYRDLNHLELIATVSDWLRAFNNRVTNEHVLPNGKRADIIYTTSGGAIHIVECKLIRSETLIYAAYDKYYQWCNGLWVASNDQTRFSPSAAYPTLEWRESQCKVGLINVGRGAVAVVREAAAHTLDRDTGDRVRAGLPSS